MMRKVLIMISFVLLPFLAKGQELRCNVQVVSQQIQGSNLQIFKTLETSLKEFLNQTKWTDRVVKPEEKVNCAFTMIVTKREDNRFTATLQVQSSRPVYGTSYESPLLNIRDEDFDFTYNEFEPLLYNRNQFDKNFLRSQFRIATDGVSPDRYNRPGT